MYKLRGGGMTLGNRRFAAFWTSLQAKGARRGFYYHFEVYSEGYSEEAKAFFFRESDSYANGWNEVARLLNMAWMLRKTWGFVTER